MKGCLHFSSFMINIVLDNVRIILVVVGKWQYGQNNESNNYKADHANASAG